MVRRSKKFPGVEWVECPNDFITIDKSKCTGCANCMNVCLAGCFEIVEKKARIKSLAECMECASCWYVCSDEAIQFFWPLGGTGYKSDWG